MQNVREYEKELRRNFIRIIWFVILCIVLNVILSKTAEMLQLPIWLDTIGTIFASCIGGYLPGIFVGLVTNLLKGLSDFSSIYYAVLNVLIAITSTFLSSRGFLKKPWKIIVFILILTAIGGGIGGILPLLFSSFETSGFITDLIYDLSDKVISVCAVVFFLRLIPDSFVKALHLRLWCQAPLEQEEIDEIKKIKCRSIFLRSKIIILLTLALSLLAVAATLISFFIYKSTLVDKYSQIAYGVGKQASSLIDPNRVEDYLEDGERAKGYIETEDALKLIRDAVHDIEYLYVYQIKEDGCHVVFDLDTEEVEGDNPGDVIPFDKSFEPMLPELFAGHEVEPIISNDSFGWLLTTYTPVLDDNGGCVCYVGTDINMSILARNQIDFFSKMVFLFLGFVILIISVVVWFIDYNVIYPVNSITLRSSEFAYNESDSLADNIEKIRRLDVHTGDEVENLYQAFLKVTEDTKGYVDQIVSNAEKMAQIHGTFGKIVDPKIRDYLLSDNPELGGTDMNVTVLFCDIRGFTTLSEQLEPHQMVLLLNRYFTALEKPITDNRGIINKYIGDAIMAVFGVPLHSSTHAEDALKASLQMRVQLEKLNREFAQEGLPEIRFGIGLNSGKVLAGNVGTPNRLEYTVIGDTVNTASRIESLCKKYSTDLLMSQATVDMLPDSINIEEVDETDVKGKANKIKIYKYRK